MNKNEYYNSKILYKNEEYKYARKLLKEWQCANNIEQECVIHHRDDTEECRKYNEEHYERWGIDENGEFTEGKYVKFMTRSAHTTYHHKGKILSEETRQKISDAHTGKSFTEETKQKLSKANSGENNPMFGVHRFGSANPFYGKKHSAETKQKLSDHFKGKPISEETRQKISNAIKGENHPMYGKSPTPESIAKNRESNIKLAKSIKYLYDVYKKNGGCLSWNGFRHMLKTGEITFEMQPISVFTNGGVE